jgi:heme a synthase
MAVAALVFLMVVVGGITRLTESGLSITEWKPITGAIPPLTHDQWMDAFRLYQQTPEYQEINRGMALSDFQFIFFWEWMHGCWDG